LCFLPFIESLLALPGSGNSHITWIRFWGAGQELGHEVTYKEEAAAKVVFK
jgi:hypothetical protein